MKIYFLNAQMSFLQLQYLEQNELNVYVEKFIREKLNKRINCSEYIAENDYGLEADVVFYFIIF